MEKVHQVELEILQTIDSICNKHKLTYFMYEGSLLGAIRHNGFIPWDDDIDIAMPRRDYDAFIKIAANELPDYMILQSLATDSHWGKVFSKVRNVNTAFKAKGDGADYISYGIFVDIFPLDYIAKDKNHISRIREKYVKTLKSHLIMCIENKSKNIPHKILSIIPIRFYMNRLKRMTSEKGEYLTCYGSEYGIRRETFHISDYFPAKVHQFENMMVPVPNQYHMILKSVYGENYMEVPPLERRYTHSPEIVSFEKGVDA